MFSLVKQFNELNKSPFDISVGTFHAIFEKTNWRQWCVLAEAAEGN